MQIRSQFIADQASAFDKAMADHHRAKAAYFDTLNAEGETARLEDRFADCQSALKAVYEAPTPDAGRMKRKVELLLAEERDDLCDMQLVALARLAFDLGQLPRAAQKSRQSETA